MNKDEYSIDLIILQCISQHPEVLKPCKETQHNISSAARFSGVYLCVDIIGFTKILADIKTIDERIQAINSISRYFSCLLDIIVEKHGQVVKFTGDGLQVIWQIPIGPKDQNILPREQVRSNFQRTQITIQLAVSCACEITEKLWDFKLSSGSNPKYLCIRSGISQGEILSIDMYSNDFESALGEGGRAENFLLGEPIQEGNKAEALFKFESLNEGVVCSKGLKQYFDDFFLKYFSVEDLESNSFIQVKYKHCRTIKEIESKVLILKKEYLKYISPVPIINNICNKHSPINFSQENFLFHEKTLTVFIKLSLNDNDLKFSTPKPYREFDKYGFISNLEPEELFIDQTLLKKYRLYFQIISENVLKNNGFLRQFVNDDKGVVAICNFGLSYLKDMDDKVIFSQNSLSWQESQESCSKKRKMESPPIPSAASEEKEQMFKCAIRSSVSIRDSLQSLGVVTSIGITCGLCCCGILGNNQRKDVVIIGESVNRSARMMTKALDGEILIDKDCHFVGSQMKWHMTPIREIELKGYNKLEEVSSFLNFKKPK